MSYYNRLLIIICLIGLLFPFSSADAQDLILRDDLASGLYYQADGNITIGTDVIGSGECTIQQGRKVVFAPTGEIRLGPGFSAIEGCQFQGVIATEDDADSDGIHDWWERAYGLDPAVDDASLDPDGDGLTNLEEFQGQTDPLIHEKPQITFSADPAVIQENGTSTLTWEILYADTAVFNPNNISIAMSSTAQVSPTETTVYRITASGPGGIVSKDVTVEVSHVLPRIIFNAAPPAIMKGASSTLSWSVVNATSVSIDQGVGTGLPLSGSQSVSPDSETTYTLTAVNSQGSASASAIVTVGFYKPSVSISAAPVIVTTGGSTTLTWSSSHAASVTVTGVTSPPLNGSAVVTPSGDTTYTITATGFGGDTAQASITVGGSTDSDNDGIADLWEQAYSKDASHDMDPDADLDGDLLTNRMEYEKGYDPYTYNNEDQSLSGTLSGTYTSGGRILLDGQVTIATGSTVTLNANCTIVLSPELVIPEGSEVVIRPGDCDHLSDAWEIEHFGTLAYDHDSDPDGDGLTNMMEYIIGSDPLVFNNDTDSDGLDDAWELTHFETLNQDASGDYDQDNIQNWVEELIGTDPTDSADYPKPGNYYEYDDDGRIKRVIRIK